MNKLFILTFIFCIVLAKAHSIFDTLVIGKYKYALQKCKPFYDQQQNGPVNLPSEYIKTPKEYVLNYKKLSDSIYTVTTDKDGNKYTVLKPAPFNCHNDSLFRKNYYVSSFTDTLKFAKEKFCDLKPYIISNKKRIYFKSSQCQVISGDTIMEVTHENMVDGDIFSFFQDCYMSRDSTLLNNKTVFLLEDLYYSKGIETFYLDRSFLLIIK